MNDIKPIEIYTIIENEIDKSVHKFLISENEYDKGFCEGIEHIFNIIKDRMFKK